MQLWSSEVSSREILTFGNSHHALVLADNLMQVYCFLYWEKQRCLKMKIFHCKSQNNQWTNACKLFGNILTTPCFEDLILSVICWKSFYELAHQHQNLNYHLRADLIRHIATLGSLKDLKKSSSLKCGIILVFEIPNFVHGIDDFIVY